MKERTQAASLKRWANGVRAELPAVEDVLPPYEEVLYVHALRGDSSFGDIALSRLYRKVLNDKLTELDRAALALIIRRMMSSAQATDVACGVGQKRGARKRGVKALVAAEQVAKKIASGLSAEDAWEKVAEESSLSASSVKQYWMQWKDSLLGLYRESIRDKAPEASEDRIEEAVRSVFRRSSKVE